MANINPITTILRYAVWRIPHSTYQVETYYCHSEAEVNAVAAQLKKDPNVSAYRLVV